LYLPNITALLFPDTFVAFIAVRNWLDKTGVVVCIDCFYAGSSGRERYQLIGFVASVIQTCILCHSTFLMALLVDHYTFVNHLDSDSWKYSLSFTHPNREYQQVPKKVPSANHNDHRHALRSLTLHHVTYFPCREACCLQLLGGRAFLL
jgi:hypothetical protein